jgi:hypothetical protein
MGRLVIHSQVSTALPHPRLSDKAGMGCSGGSIYVPLINGLSLKALTQESKQ